MTTPLDPIKQRSKTPRVVTALFGAFFILLAVAILLSADRSMIVRAVLGALVIGLLGVDACISAARDKPSLLQRIGPLP